MPSSRSGGQKSAFEEALRVCKEREKSYRERALKILPHVCARCGREFSGKRLRELTVHHKDHNHDNNPPDGSNWELLCLYCHENEHARDRVADAYEAEPVRETLRDGFRHNPFAGLAGLMADKKNE